MESEAPLNRRLPRFDRMENYPAIQIGRPKQAILEAIGRFHYLSARQLAALLFSKGSLTYVQEHCSHLFQAKYLQRVYLPRRQPGGSPLAVYTLDKRGYRWLTEHEKAPAGRFRSSEEARREELFLAHTLAANDFLILAQLLSKRNSSFTVGRMISERELKREPVYVTNGSIKRAVIPDGWLDLRLFGKQQMCLAIEIDRGTTDRERFQRKIRSYIAYAQGPYQEAFHTPSLTILFITPVGQKRLEEMLTWTKKELERLQILRFADLFRFAAFDPSVEEPETIFYSPIWQKPGEELPVSIIFAPGGQQ